MIPMIGGKQVKHVEYVFLKYCLENMSYNRKMMHLQKMFSQVSPGLSLPIQSVAALRVLLKHQSPSSHLAVPYPAVFHIQ